MPKRQAMQGQERERSLPLSAYFEDSYFELPQLFSLAHQVRGIYEMRPSSLLEIGIGNGFVSEFFKKSGIPVTTADINPALHPDILAPLHELPGHMMGKQTDVVVCCEVLEHLPLEELPVNIELLRSLGSRLFLTLPNYRKTFGLGGIIRLPKLRPSLWSLTIDFPGKKQLPPEHFWEVGYCPASSNGNILRLLRNHYRTVTASRFTLNRYHRVYIASA